MSNTRSRKPAKPKKPVTIPENLDQIIKPRQMAQLTGRSLSSLWRDVKAGRLEKPIRTGVQATGWTRSQYETWLASRAQAA